MSDLYTLPVNGGKNRKKNREQLGTSFIETCLNIH